MESKQKEPALNFSHASKSAFKYWLVFSMSLAALAVIQFLGASGIAMMHFPEGYSFEGNFLSDLGRSTHDYSDLYNFSVVSLGLGLIPLFLTLIIVDPRNSFSMKLTSGFGCLSALGLIGLGLTPIDRLFVMHHVALGIWLFPMFYMTIVFFYSASRSSLVGVGYLSASFVMVIAMLVLLLRSDSGGYEVTQKLIVACGLVWLAYIIGFIWQSGRVILKSIRDPDFTDKEAEDQYFSEMYRQKAAKERL